MNLNWSERHNTKLREIIFFKNSSFETLCEEKIRARKVVYIFINPACFVAQPPLDKALK